MRIPIIPGEIEAEFGELTPQQIARLIKAEDSKGRALSIEEIGELLRKLRRSKKFRIWSPETAPIGDKSVTERHYSPQELAISWGVSAETIRILFRKETGVLRIPSRQANGKKRSYVNLRIPESAAQRVHRRLSAIPQ